MWSALPKIQKCVVTLCHSPRDDTPTAATIAVKTGGGNMETKKNIFANQ